MSFKSMHLRLTQDGISRRWSYWTEDTATKVMARDYFESIKEILRVGDWIFVTSSTGGIILHVDDTDPLEINKPL